MTDDTPSSGQGRPWRNFHGRVHGKKLKPAQQRYLAEDLGPLSPGPVSHEDNPERAPLDLAALFGGRPVWLEIGFGGGEHLVHVAQAHPEIGFIGSEPFVNGVAMLLGKIREAAVDNLRVHDGDVRDLFDVLPAGAIGRVWLNYPDPWPKARHHKRRFVTPQYLAPLHRVMARGAELRIATDIESYVEQTLEELPKAGLERVDHPIHEPWQGWPSTRYEQKALREGRSPHYLIWRKP